MSNCSMLEAIELCQQVAGRELGWTLVDENRIGDHRWWITDLAPFQHDYPHWQVTYDVQAILEEIHQQNADLWTTVT